jgi:dTDP-4-dehydrorhamnose reductase
VPKLLVTGVSGDLGSVVASRARDAGWAVVGAVGRRVEAAPPGLDAVVAVDVRDAAAVADLVARTAPDAIVHTAYVQGDDAQAVNADGSGNVARAAAAAGARLVHVSSDAIFDGTLGRPLREDDAPRPVTAYGATKLAAEVAVARLCPAAAIVRTSLIYAGPDREPVAQELVPLAVAHGEQPDMMFYSDEVRSPVQVDDLAAALLALARTEWAGPLNVAGADDVSRLELAQLVVAARGLDPGLLRGTPAPPDRPRHCALDSSRARALLDVDLRGVRTVLRAPH